ncbi:MAG: PAS domain S-box protein [Thermoanaerobaculaceae bacterium]|nr:PAS domain S-box protein [Thermoanaerobaculaceae bacterium]MDI9622988.1 ATP-binding protein [Acidobacteriota bacterium]NLH12149.1 PAS domain S-box protein [Holophagae bacterium]HPW54967.1 ATP-binding protein [Thermoanaerobaculaceae bacterium]
MSVPLALRADPPAGPESPIPGLARAVKWLVGLRLLAVSGLFVGALLVQVSSEDILPIAPLIRVAGLAYLLSLVWIVLLLLRIPPGLFGGLQLVGDLAVVTALIYMTGGPSSPFSFLFMIPVAVGAHLFGLRGALTTAGAAFIAYAGLVELIAFHLVAPPSFSSQASLAGRTSLGLQLVVTGIGFAIVAILTSFLAHSVHRAERQLLGERTASARFLALSDDIVRSVDSGVLAVDLEGQIVLGNPAATRILGRDEAVEGKQVGQLLALENVSWVDVLKRVAVTGPVKLEGTEVGRRVPVGCTVTPLRTAEGNLVGFVIHFRDLTEVRESARRESLRERMVAVGQMAAGIAHEIRNPLASISGSAQVLGKVPGLRESERRLSRIIVEESRRLSSTIEAFLAYARPPEPHPGPCQIGSILADTLALFANSAEVTPAHHLDLDIRSHPEPVTADERQLRQAFFNLARNAIQAMPHGGTMRVVAAPEDGEYVIRWSDEGIGMTTPQIDEIFQPFKAFRQGGTGLGLAVVYSIVSDHRGDITVESVPDQGSTFTLRFPLGLP